jgi:RNA polymerase sigma factor (sigma-70 family)
MPTGDFESSRARAPASAARFTNTHWSIVWSATDRRNPSQAKEALEKLCRVYWPPLYAFVRHQGDNPHDAQDLTQAFFERLLEKDYLQSVNREKGRFRSFLLASLKHFLANERDKARAQKRGGGHVTIPLDFQSAETRYTVEPVEQLTPEIIFERRWAMALLDQTMMRLREDYTVRGKGVLFDVLKGTLTEARGSIPYSALAIRLGLSEAAVKMAVHRLRQRYREVLRAEVAETVATPGEVDDELREVLRVLSG